MEPEPSRELILKIFAARTGAELERKQVEASLLLAKDAAELRTVLRVLFGEHEPRTANAIEHNFGIFSVDGKRSYPNR